MTTFIQTKLDQPPFNLAEATNIYLTEEVLEAEDNYGRFEAMRPPPGAWKDFFQRMVSEKAKASRRKASNFTMPFLGERYRCILADSSHGWGITMRKLMKEIPRIQEDLHLDWAALQPLMEGTGLTIFAGQMGSGKSTTMISAIDKLGRAKRGPLGTVEDPIEVEFQGGSVIQREVGTHVDSFEEAIKDFVRQYRKTIMVGEIRDPITANAAVLAASLGHSVYATLHADSAVDIVPRMQALLDPQLKPILATTLRGLWWQHVFRRGNDRSNPLPIYESLSVTNSVRQIISDGPDKLPQLMQEMHAQQRKTMAQTAMIHINNRKASRAELHQWLEKRGRISDEQLGFR